MFERRPGADRVAFADRCRRFAAAHAGILAAAIAYIVVDTLIRLEMAGLTTDGLKVAGAAKNAFFDVLVISVLATFCLVLGQLVRGRETLCRVIEVTFAATGLLLVLLACMNRQALAIIGGPLTYQWLYYGDLLSSYTSQLAVRGAINSRFLLIVLLAIVAYGALYFGLKVLLRSPRFARYVPALLALGITTLAIFLFIASDRRNVPEADRVHAANPLMELVLSALNGDTSNLLDAKDAVFLAALPPPTHDRSLLPADLRGSVGKNVILVVLESVSAKHVAGTAPKGASLTPNLERYADRTLVFTNAYAHVGYSSKSLFSIVTGRLPLFSIKVETYEFQQTPMATIASRMKQLGYRTALFMSGDLSFQSADEFLSGRGFDRIADMETIPCPFVTYEASTSEWPEGKSVDDKCTVDALMAWATRPSRQPFFALMWTGNTHWPYFSKPEPRPGELAAEETLNRYVAAVRSSDRAIGAMLDDLARRGMFNDTIVIVVSDHGEAFGEHGYSLHANTIFEEEVRVPMLIIGPDIQGRSISTLTALSDVAPTILHLVGADPENSWDGRSVFDRNRLSRVMLFAPNQELSMGFREGRYKHIYQPARGRALAFDLEADPQETRNVAERFGEDYARRRVAGWLQEQQRRTESR